jgi:arylformamidase
MPMSELIDISVALRPEMPIWPSSRGFRRSSTLSFAAGDGVNVSQIEMDVHCGTHIEGPLHYVDGGAPVDSIGLDVLIGNASVVDLAGAASIGPAELEAAEIRPDCQRLLLKTANSGRWADGEPFSPDYVALTVDGARWVAERGVRLVGVDYLSVQRMEDPPDTHRVLMQESVAILEGLDLSAVNAGEYRLICQPLRIPGAEAAPARAVLERLP